MNLIKAIFDDLKSVFTYFINLTPKIKKQKYWIYGFIGLVLLLCFLFSHSKGNNDLTNWISALANVVMAGAAISGVLFALNWKKDATKEKVIDLCIEYLTVRLPEINGAYSQNLHDIIIQRWLESLKGKPYLYKDAAFIHPMAVFLKSSHSKHTEALLNSRKDLERINYLSWGLTNDYQKIHHEMERLMLQIRDSQLTVITYIEQLMGIFNIKINSILPEHNDNHLQYNLDDDWRVQYIFDQTQIIIDCKKDLINKLKVLQDRDKTIFDYFSVK